MLALPEPASVAANTNCVLYAVAVVARTKASLGAITDIEGNWKYGRCRICYELFTKEEIEQHTQQVHDSKYVTEVTNLGNQIKPQESKYRQHVWKWSRLISRQ